MNTHIGGNEAAGEAVEEQTFEDILSELPYNVESEVFERLREAFSSPSELARQLLAAQVIWDDVLQIKGIGVAAAQLIADAVRSMYPSIRDLPLVSRYYHPKAKGYVHLSEVQYELYDIIRSWGPLGIYEVEAKYSEGKSLNQHQKGTTTRSLRILVSKGIGICQDEEGRYYYDESQITVTRLEEEEDTVEETMDFDDTTPESDHNAPEGQPDLSGGQEATDLEQLILELQQELTNAHKEEQEADTVHQWLLELYLAARENHIEIKTRIDQLQREFKNAVRDLADLAGSNKE